MRYFLLLLSLLIISCNNVNELDENIFENTEALVLDRLNLIIKEVSDGKFSVLYDDGHKLEISQSSTKSYVSIIVTGSKIYNQTIEFKFNNEEINLLEGMSYFSHDLNRIIKNNELGYFINGFEKAPCSEHASEESFVPCFKREIDEFCNSIASCVFLAANAKIVATIVAIHCVYCSKTESSE